MIETARLILRPWAERDRDGFAAMNADPDVAGDFPGLMTRRESDDLMDQFRAIWAEDGFGYGAIERRADGAFLGMAGIAMCRLDAPLCPCFEIGWALARAHWGQGYATEAARAWLDHGFARLDLPEIVAFTDPANLRSQRTMARLGLHRDPDSDFDHPDLPENHPIRPQLVYSLTCDQWRAGRQ